MASREGDPLRRKSRREEEKPKTNDRDRERERERARTAPKKKHLRRRSTPERGSRALSPDASRLSRSSMSDLPSRLRASTLSATPAVPEMARRVSVGDSKVSAYPAFSKEHSREAVRPNESPTKSKGSAPPPHGTDGDANNRAKYRRRGSGSEGATRAPPSPPLTSDEGDIKKASANGNRRSQDGHDSPRQSADLGARPRISNLKAEAATSPRKVSRGDESDSSSKTVESSRGTARRYASGTHMHRNAVERDRSSAARKPSGASVGRISPIPSKTDSQTTPIAAGRRSPATASHQDHSPLPSFNSRGPPVMQSTPVNPLQKPQSTTPGGFSHPAKATTSMAPPPFITPTIETQHTQPPNNPPPSEYTDEPPRVDYLLLNGGLPHLIPRSLIPINKHPASHTYQQYSTLQPTQITSSLDAVQVFSPIVRRLDDLDKVLSKNGSVAVATGYRSVARRLLDRLEHVFARNISSEKCHCVVCKTSQTANKSEEDIGVSWGEILEFVSGRRELPPWPPFTFDAATGSIELNGRVDKPMQKLDPDVPEEFKQHYMRQNDKTKRSVQDWLAAQAVDTPQPDAPRDVDDETLAFAMLTRLDPNTRPLFAALMKGQTSLPSSRSTTPTNDGKNTVDNTLEKTSLALQRLYRLVARPRKPESTLYLLNHPDLHGMLATLAAISPAEWDILVSGRFDGFLWSGAEPHVPSLSANHSTQAAPQGLNPLSRVTSPLSPSAPRISPMSTLRSHTFSPGPLRGSTPFSTAGSTMTGTTSLPSSSGGPVQLDEETEIAILSELERSIYRDMELLEDAFETLHQRAEVLRGQLRSRAAGLSAAAQARVAASDDAAAAAAASSEQANATPEIDMDDGFSELAPDDSASNISFARRSRRGAERRGYAAGLDDAGRGGTVADQRRRR
ncbi:hypothetical protein ANO11243_014110 [Dothideomycetidae sp. 11243]|nr:hypothetical protein ANO11243_014110 [fungal sp. No.11243]